MNERIRREARKPSLPTFKKSDASATQKKPISQQKPTLKEIMRQQRQERHLPLRLRQMHAK